MSVNMSANRGHILNLRKISEQITSEPSTSHELPEPVTVASPSTRGQTSNLYTSQITETGSLSAKVNLDTEPPQTGLDSRVARPRVCRSRKLNSPYESKTTVQSSIDPEWVKRLENRRVDALTRLADTALIIAESSLTQAKANKVQAETAKVLAETAKVQASTMRSLVDLIHSNALMQQKCIHALVDKKTDEK